MTELESLREEARQLEEKLRATYRKISIILHESPVPKNERTRVFPNLDVKTRASVLASISGFWKQKIMNQGKLSEFVNLADLAFVWMQHYGARYGDADIPLEHINLHLYKLKKRALRKIQDCPA